ncbi:MAG TPA: alpha/beta hydrolase-fold protein [Candidatus Dormibacteraeota bacterium]
MQVPAPETETGAPGAHRAARARARLDRVAHHRLTQAALALAAVLLLWLLLGGGLSGWAVGLGMDEQRGTLVAALIAVLAGSGVATLLGARPGPARAGCLLGLVAVEVVPFLAGAARSGPTGGLATRTVAFGWVAQPLGMLLLGAVAATAGAAIGALLRADALVVWARLRRSRRAWPPLVAGITLAALVAAPAATTALQDGSLTALYSYSAPGSHLGSGHPGPGVVAAATGRQFPAGRIDPISVGGRSVRVYLPPSYALQPGTSFPVVYFLHGYPSTELQWLSGAQLPGVLDQLIATRVVPPLLAVLPDGNGRVSADAEWADTARGDRIEDWLINSVVPGVDARYRTLGAGHRGVAGLSAGGFGALNIATRHPRLFSWAASYSGYFAARPGFFAGPAAAANSPLLTVTHVAAQERMPVYVGVGTGDGRYLDTNEGFVAELRRLGWEPVSFDVVPGGHGWAAWRLELVHSLEWLGTLWPPPADRPPAESAVE